MVFERYNCKVKKALSNSRREAGYCGATVIDTVHLLLGLLVEDTPLFRRLSHEANFTNTLRMGLKALLTRGDRVSDSVDIPISQEYRDVLTRSADEARVYGAACIEAKHLLLAMLQVKDCLAGAVLLDIGLTYDAVREGCN